MKPEAEFLGLRFDTLDLRGVERWIEVRANEQTFAYIVTPNVDHMVRLAEGTPAFRRIYENADLCVCDSRVLARLAAMSGVRLPVTPGSDLVAALFDHGFRSGDRICLIGSTPRHAARLAALHPELHILQHCPPMGLKRNAAARAEAVRFAENAKARIILIAVGSPQGEMLVSEMADRELAQGTALCIGASVDFIVGAQRRAPLLVRRAGMEWAWRLASQPRRLARRYLVSGPAIFPLVWRWYRQQRAARR